VLLQTEDLAVIESDSLEHTVPIEKAVIKDRDLSLGFRVESTVDIDLHRRVTMEKDLLSEKPQIQEPD
jgi:hypothetical protein